MLRPSRTIGKVQMVGLSRSYSLMLTTCRIPASIRASKPYMPPSHATRLLASLLFSILEPRQPARFG